MPVWKDFFDTCVILLLLMSGNNLLSSELIWSLVAASETVHEVHDLADSVRFESVFNTFHVGHLLEDLSKILTFINIHIHVQVL